MRVFLLAALILAPECVHADAKYGQYLCTIQHTAGIKPQEAPETYSGKITLEATLLAFSINIRPVNIDRNICKKQMQNYNEYLETETPLKDFDTNFGQHPFSRAFIMRQCLMKDDLTMSRGGTQWHYGSLDLAFQFYGYDTDHWFDLYSTGLFRMGEAFDGGAVAVSDGVCVRLTP